MALEDVTPLVRYSGSGTRGPFALALSGADIEYLASGHVIVERIDSDGDATILVDGVDYDLTGTLDEDTQRYVDGAVLLRVTEDVLAAVSGDEPAEKLVIYRRTPLTQTLELTYNAAFPSDSFNQLANKLAMLIQEVRVEARQALRMPMADAGVTVSARDTRAGKVMGFDSDGAYQEGLVRDFGDNAIEIDDFAFTGDGATTAWTISNVRIPNAAGVLVWVGGVKQTTADYEISYDGDDTILTISPAVSNGVEIDGHILGFQSEISTGPTGAAGADGAAIYSGAGAPSSGTGANGDLYIRTSNGDLYQKSGGAWGSPIMSIVGPSGVGTGDMLKTENLSGLANTTTALTNLGLPANARSFVTAADYAAMRTALSVSSTAEIAAAYQPLDGDLTAIAALSTTSYGRALLALADVAALRTAYGLSVPVTEAQGGTGATAFATAAEIRTGTAAKVTAVDDMIAALVPVTITYGASVALDLSTFINGKITLTGNISFSQPTNLKPGTSGVIEIIQDGTGSRTATWHADFLWAGGTDGVLTTTAGARDLLSYYVTNDSKLAVALNKAFA